MPIEEANKLYDLLVLLLLLAVPFVLAGLWVAYRLVRGHRWRQKELLHSNIAILNTNQAILALLLRAVPPEKHAPRAAAPVARKRKPDAAAPEASEAAGEKTPPSP